MQTEIIKLNEHKYICELEENCVEKSYVMLRNYNINNNFLATNDIYIIDKDFIEKDNINVVYPIPNVIQQFSDNISDFIQIGNVNLYKFYDNKFKEKTITSNRLKIYHPTSKINNDDIIVYVDLYIKDIHVHLFCKKYNDINYNAENEIKMYNNLYSEYIEVYIPNIDSLFSRNTYYIEDVFNVVIANNSFKNLKLENNNLIYCSTYLFTLPYINDSNSLIYKNYNDVSIENNYIMYPFNVTLYQYNLNLYKSNNNNYIISDDSIPNTVIFVEAPKITISTDFTFNEYEGKLVAKCYFNYINKDKFANLSAAYEYYNNININKDYNNIFYSVDDENYNETTDHKQYQCIYIMEIASDINFNDIIYRSPLIEGYNLSNEIKNIEFSIPAIFNDWDKKPDLLVYRIIFLDRYLGTSIKSNIKMFTDENYKYLVNNEDKIYCLNLKDMDDKILFIDKIECKLNNEIIYNKLVAPKDSFKNTILKPIFYRTQDLQNIQIQSNVTQNIGIDLTNYLSKVETFFLNIGENKFIEYGRNNIYVIFKINANLLKGNSGSYYITNQDNEYISSGNWSLLV